LCFMISVNDTIDKIRSKTNLLSPECNTVRFT
jgi:hypothetical protein